MEVDLDASAHFSCWCSPLSLLGPYDPNLAQVVRSESLTGNHRQRPCANSMEELLWGINHFDSGIDEKQ